MFAIEIDQMMLNRMYSASIAHKVGWAALCLCYPWCQVQYISNQTPVDLKGLVSIKEIELF